MPHVRGTFALRVVHGTGGAIPTISAIRGNWFGQLLESRRRTCLHPLPLPEKSMPRHRVSEFRHALLSLCRLALCLSLSASLSPTALAEMSVVRVGTQFGLNYLPLFVMEHDRLWEKHADALGIRTRIEYARLGGGATLNDALLSDSIQVAAGGLTPMLLLWNRTSGSSKIIALAALNVAINDVLCNRPDVHSIADLTPQDRIALPAVKSSVQAVILMAAAEKAFGKDEAHRFDGLTVTMQHPDALTALLTRSGPVTVYISSSPYQEIALKRPDITKLTDNKEVFGGPTTLTAIYGKDRFIHDNPTAMRAFYAALDEAVEFITAHPHEAIEEYLEVTHEKADRALLAEILASPDFYFRTTPVNSMVIAERMHRYGLLHQAPTSWRDYFAQPLHDTPGS
jgi:NitT/TauT family transport system substrate-binding protein